MWSTYRKAQTPLTTNHLVAVTHNNAFCHQLVINLVSIRHLYQQKVRITLKHLYHTSQVTQGLSQHLSLCHNLCHMCIVRFCFQAPHHLLLCGSVHVIRILHTSKELRNRLSCKSQSQTQTCHAPCLRECLQHHQIGMFIQHRKHTAFF